MNAWYIASLAISGFALLFLIVCIIIVIGPMKKTADRMNEILMRIQKRMEALLHEVTRLTATAQTLQGRVELTKQAVQETVQSVKEVSTALTVVQTTTKQTMQTVMKRTEDDPYQQAQTEEWTNKALLFLNRKNKAS